MQFTAGNMRRTVIRGATCAGWDQGCTSRAEGMPNQGREANAVEAHMERQGAGFSALARQGEG